jgi:2-polyprenyl-6-methoxyphenol hydroxylase-like FAD-dependent oxidoreductase
MKIQNWCKIISLFHLLLTSTLVAAFIPSSSQSSSSSSSRYDSIHYQHQSFEKKYFKGRKVSTEIKGQIGEKHAIVIGGGPVGLASALVLANPPHLYNVTVYEATNRQTTQSRCLFDPALAYLYNVNARGQTFTKAFPLIHENLMERSVAASQTQFVLSPANLKDDVIIRSVPSMSDEESYWIPRHEMVNLLQDAIDHHNAKTSFENSVETQNCNLGKIEVQSGMECINVIPETSSSFCKVQVVLENQEGDRTTSCANLVVAADGIHSKVRQCLLEGSKVFAEWKNFKAKKFKVKKWISPASGLRLKALQLPANFTLKSGGEANDRSQVTMQNNNIVAIRGLKDGPRDFLSLGCLPMKDDVTTRPANAITRPDHVLWTLKTGEEVQRWYEDNFPRMSFQKEEYGGIVSKEEWERFARAEGTTFPPCQYTPGLQASSLDGKCGIVLLGDSGKITQTWHSLFFE